MRLEHDLLGEKSIPDDAYYGVQSARAMENFHISGVPISQYPDLIRALAMVKLAAARANYECKQFSKEILTGIEKACQEIIDGKHSAGPDIPIKWISRTVITHNYQSLPGGPDNKTFRLQIVFFNACPMRESALADKYGGGRHRAAFQDNGNFFPGDF